MALADRRVVEIKARRTARRPHHAAVDRRHRRPRPAGAAGGSRRFVGGSLRLLRRKDRLILANELYAHLCGVKTLDELMGKTFPEIAAQVAYSGRIVLDEPPEQWLERRLKGHRDPMGAVTIRTNTGEAYLVRDRATPDGGRVMVFTDITDKFRAETALAEQQHALADADAQAEQQKSYLADLATRLDAGQRQRGQRQDHPAAHHGP